ncbi:tRNA (adenosine(37)-N6)-threonylcarbamoyltransferase complex transferase subunit TsaD [Candidatus Kaiserbacteria bacterium]|nr:tRNA (adenosine(37)-N6)-threonylcarbamoyltransferase complex transferase subunit TsaD [Candidatus Kaiserbacteria bacterium]
MAATMKILGIETSADETGVSLIEAEGSFDENFHFKILGNALASQIELHREYGGIYPNLAKREHAKALVPLLIDTLTQAGSLKKDEGPTFVKGLFHEILKKEPELLEALIPLLGSYERPQIDAIAVTVGPGLEPTLWVGINFARALSSAWNIPIVEVNHMEGHVVMPMMENGHFREFEFPTMALLISGGHTELVLSREFGKYERIGETRDDAAGEAFDKVARLLDLPYPGGPEISRLAAEARSRNLQPDFKFTRPMLRDDNFDFSFSGLKTAVRKLVESQGPTFKNSPRSDLEKFKMQIALEFEECVAETLVEKTLRAADEFDVDTIIVGGGVSANARIKELLANRMMQSAGPRRLLVTSPELATDNALMIALAGYFHAQRGEFTVSDSLVANGNLRLETLS